MNFDNSSNQNDEMQSETMKTGDEIPLTIIDVSIDYDEVIQQITKVFIKEDNQVPPSKKSSLEKDSENTSLVLLEKDMPKEQEPTVEKENLCNLQPQVILRKINVSDMQKSVEDHLTTRPLQMKLKKGRPKKSKPIRHDHWNIRRSERIQMMLIQKECNLAASAVTSEPTLEKSNTSQQKRKYSKGKQKSSKTAAHRSLVDPTTLSNAMHYVKVPERVEGFVNRGGEEYVIVKWKDLNYPEHISTKNMSDDLKRLVVSYLHSHLLMLSPNKKASQKQNHLSLLREEHAPVVREDSVCQEREDHVSLATEYPVCQEREEEHLSLVREEPVFQEREEHVSLAREDLCQETEEQLCPEVGKDHSAVSQEQLLVNLKCTVNNNNNIPAQLPSLHVQKINISHYKNQQKLFIKESGLFDKENSYALDVKLSI